MPYIISKKGSRWVVKNKETGKVKGTHKSRFNALKQMRLLYMVESGKKPTGKPSTLKKRKKKTPHYKTS